MVDFLRRSWAVIDLDCIDYNIRSIKEKLKPGCMIMGVVKADAYGHGDKYIADELVRLGVNWFAVSNLQTKQNSCVSTILPRQYFLWSMQKNCSSRHREPV